MSVSLSKSKTSRTPDNQHHTLVAHTIRGLAMDAVQKANSGHPGMPMGMADVAVVLWSKFLRHNPADPAWFNRDRFVLSAGHGSMLLYSLLHLSGYGLTLDDLKQFRQWGSRTPGHPENFMTPGVETTTGPLGQGLANAVGMALAERHLAARFNRPDFNIVDHHTYVIASDGDLMEGVAYEACSLAGHWKLGRLIVLYDDNGITIDGSTDLSFSEDVAARFQAQGWHTLKVDGHNPDAVERAILVAYADERPSLIACRTHIGYGSPNKQDSASSHGSPLGEEEIQRTKENLGWPTEPAFYVPQEAYAYFGNATQKSQRIQAQWSNLLDTYQTKYPELHAELISAQKGTFRDGWEDDLPVFEAGQKIATRGASGTTLTALKAAVPWLIGGSGDLTGSNKTRGADDVPMMADNFSGRYLHFGIREHAMGAILNGLNLHGSVRAYGGTFLVFSDYMRPTIRLAALMNVPTIYVFTHDSIGLGEDGPTHQPIEHLASLRAIPNLKVFRPADANETVECWKLALTLPGPSALALTRQKLPVIDRDQYAPTNVEQGGYILSEAKNARVILMATGSEVPLALEAQALLEADSIAARVVAMPCWELFDAQPDEYRQQVLPSSIEARVAIEAGTTFGWSRYLGAYGEVIGLDRFGGSAPYEVLYENLGLTAEEMVKAAHRSLERANP